MSVRARRSAAHIGPSRDTGAVVRQEQVPVLAGDTLESLKARCKCEREAVVETLAAIATGELLLRKNADQNR
jgi:folate-dependent phosphoribosylglycinamide formyltransferase PurN